MVAVRIEGYETDLRKKVKEAGGKWKPDKQLWHVRFGGVNKNSYWVASLEFHDKPTLKAQLNIALDRMSEARETVTDIVSSGGTAGIYLMFPGSSNIGTSIDRYTLGRFVELGLELDIEVFPGS